MKPNIILFTTDQQRGDHISISGHPVVETPNVDSFVNNGAYFPNAYTEIPSTTGARRCLLSGKGSYDCGLVGYSAAEWHEHNTLARVLIMVTTVLMSAFGTFIHPVNFMVSIR